MSADELANRMTNDLMKDLGVKRRRGNRTSS